MRTFRGMVTKHITMGLTFNGSSEGCVDRIVEMNLALSLGEEQIEGIIPIFLFDFLRD